MDIDKKILQSNLELLMECSSVSVNEDMSDKIMFYPQGMANISRGRLVTYITCDIDFEGVFVLENILKIVKALPGDTISMNFADDELKISSTTKTRLGFKPIQVENWMSRFINTPLSTLEGTQPDFRKLPSNFLEGLQAVASCAASSKNSGILNNVAITGSDLIASDNFKIGHYVMKGGFKESFLIDEYNIKGILKFNPETYFLMEDRIVFCTEFNTMICAINPMGKYPDFLPVINRSTEEATKLVMPDELKELVFIAQQIPGKDVDSKIQLTIGKNKLALSYNTINGWFRKNIRIDYDAAPFNINMNINTLATGLSDLGQEIFISEEGTGSMKLGDFTIIFPIEII